MKIENVSVYNFENALRGMRNPYDSWAKSDSGICYNKFDLKDDNCDNHPGCEYCAQSGMFIIGPNDLKLCQTLITAGNEHRKFMRQILVSADLTLPFYQWKELDTYKVATVANSCSTMHTLLKTPITTDLFECDDYNNYLHMIDDTIIGVKISNFLNDLEQLRQLANQYKEDGNIELAKKYEKELIRWLPESFLQKRTWTSNYETLRSIYFQRKSHKLMEWHTFCNWIESLPYGKELICYGQSSNK